MIKAFGKAGEWIAEFWSEVCEDKINFLLLYLLVCGGAANIFAGWWFLRWCTEHVRIV